MSRLESGYKSDVLRLTQGSELRHSPLGRCDIPDDRRKSELHKHMVNYIYVIQYIQRNGLEIRLPAHWNLNGHSMMPPRMCCRPALFFRQLRLIVVSFPRGKIRCAFQTGSSIFAFLKIWWVWNCLRQGVSTTGLILKVVNNYLDYNMVGVIESKVNKERSSNS